MSAITQWAYEVKESGMKSSKSRYIVSVLAVSVSSMALLLLSGCVPVAVGGAALAGSTMVGNEEGVTGSISDTNLQTKVNLALKSAGEDLIDRVEFCVKHGMVVAIGYVKSEEQHMKALEAIRKVKCYHAEIYDEIKVQRQPTSKEVFADGAITTRIKTALKFDGNVQSLNYDTTTVKGVVYICGTAMSEFERDTVINCARSTSGVSRVIAYIKVKKKTQTSRNTHHEVAGGQMSSDDL